jgi:IS1 family transposase
VALAAAARFVIAWHVGPRTLSSARDLLAQVGACCRPAQPLLIEVDQHRPYPQAILDVFGLTRFRRRRHGLGRRKHPDLKPPPGLLAGVVQKVHDDRDRLVAVHTRRLFGRRREILKTLDRLSLGHHINTSHVERINATLRTQQTRLARRTRNVSHRLPALRSALALWGDLYHWTRCHASLHGRTPAMALGLAQQVWSVQRYVHYPVHRAAWQRALWMERRQELLTRGLYQRKPPQTLPIS